MAKKGSGEEIQDASLGGKLTQDALTEDEADELRAEGRGFDPDRSWSGRESDPSIGAPGAAASQPGRMLAGSGENLGGHGAQVRDNRGAGGKGRHAEGEVRDESELVRRRSVGETFSEGERTQVEEDFGERGLRMRGGIHDKENKPSILDPEPEE